MASPTPSRSPRRATAWFAALAALLTPAAQATLQPADEARLLAVQQSADSAGAWVYDGIVHPLDAPTGQPLFSYQRRVQPAGGGLIATHVTRDPQGRVLIVESAAVAADYTLRSFDAVNRQLGSSGSVQASPDGRQLHYRLVEGDRVRSATEIIDAPAVTGPSLHGHILQHWDALSAGRVHAVRIVVLSRLESIPFEIRRAGGSDAAEPGCRAFTITPARWSMRLVVKPLRVEFDEATRQVRRYEGRVPPLQQADGKLKPLDARVDYPRHAPIYR
jgi:hypothetical protein